MERHDIAIVGAGPVGLELAVAFRRADIDYVHFESGQIGQTMFDWTPNTRWFSSTERIQIAGVPIQNATQSKCTREEYLAYLRSIVLQFDLDVRTYEKVVTLSRADRGFVVRTETATGLVRECEVERIVLCTGGNAWPNRLDIPGEDLPHVCHVLDDPHAYFGRRLLVVGGRNSAVEAALRCHHAGARVSLSYRGDAFPRGVKYWLRPEIDDLIKTGRMPAWFRTHPTTITEEHVRLEPIDGGESIDVPVDFVLLATGYLADMTLFKTAGAGLQGDNDVPVFDETTMETDIPGLFVAGTAVAGTQRSGVKVFLENCHIHTERILASITGAPPPDEPERYSLVES